MASTYSDLKIELIATGEQSGTWGTTTNTNLGTALEEAIVGRATANFTTDADLTLTLTDTNATQVARHYILNVTSGVSLSTTRNLIVPTIDKPYIIENNTTGSQSIVVKTSAGTGVTVPNGKKVMVYANSTDVVAAQDHIPSLTLGAALPLASGGTGANLSDPNADRILFWDDSASSVAFLEAGSGLSISGTTISATGSGGTVTSVAFSGGTTGFTVSGSPITTSGTITLAGTLNVANGGTGATSLTSNNVILGNGTSAVQFVAPSTSGNVLTSNGTTWTSAAPAVTLAGNNAFTGANTFYNSTGQTFGTATSTQDGVIVAGRAGGSSSYRVTLTPASLSGSRTLSIPDPGSNETLGYLNIPQNSQSTAYTLVLTDAGKHILHPSADTTARTFTIPANGSVPFPIGTAVTFVNQNGAGVVTIAITTDTMRLAGAGTTGSRTLAANGVATAIKITSTEWIISGTGLT